MPLDLSIWARRTSSLKYEFPPSMTTCLVRAAPPEPLQSPRSVLRRGPSSKQSAAFRVSSRNLLTTCRRLPPRKPAASRCLAIDCRRRSGDRLSSIDAPCWHPFGQVQSFQVARDLSYSNNCGLQCGQSLTQLLGKMDAQGSTSAAFRIFRFDRFDFSEPADMALFTAEAGREERGHQLKR